MRQHARFVAALFLVSLALRPQIIGAGPLIPAIQGDLGISHTVAGLLGTIPVLCMGIFAPAAAYVAGAIGPLGIRVEPWGKTGIDEAEEYFREQAKALHEGGVERCLRTKPNPE